jgi:hypothetical protein
LGIFSLKDPLEGIEVDIRIARVLNNLDSVYNQKGVTE